LAIPFAYAMASLAAREYDSFPRLVLPWVGLGVVTLGIGIFLGAYWAYKTLGWGGYWGWDPVENSSLIPWVITLALLHGLLVQRRQNKLVRTNLLLAILALLLVVYGTFLTRSGVLADFSVHSFTDLGINVYLVGFMLLLVIGCPGLLLWRARSISTDRLDPNPTSREFGLTLGLLVLVVISFLVLLGTSAPLLTRIFGDPANVTLAYYSSISIPAGIALLLLLVVIPFTRAGRTSANELIKKAFWPAVAATVVTIIVVLMADLQFSDLVLIFFGVWALGTNIHAIILLPRLTLLRVGGPLAHFGFALMVLGIVASSNYGSAQRVTLQTGVPNAAMGYEMTYLSRVNSTRVEDGYLNIRLISKGRTQFARPKLYYAEYTNSVMRNPHVIEGLLRDIYIAPLDLQTIEEPGGITRLELAQNKPVVSGDYTITFVGFEMGDHEADQIAVGARLTVAGPDDTGKVIPRYISGPGNQVSSPPLTIPGAGLTISLERIKVESHSVQVAIHNPAMAASPGKELLTLEISRKPLISLIWLGITLVTLGAVLSFFRRWSHLKGSMAENPAPPTAIK
jgi:cytochrome c-type biogenesis protein CcmF